MYTGNMLNFKCFICDIYTLVIQYVWYEITLNEWKRAAAADRRGGKNVKQTVKQISGRYQDAPGAF